ncbi:unnamed protein product [Rhizophagus irregularis]|nr:unnamed protein product [Rhizophagus irregularis]CAB5386936.1 unnamed protein product [Rhizophagus irregularis]
MKPLTPKTHGAIVYGHNCGHSSRTIAKQLGCGKTTINDIFKRLRETHSLIPKKQTGRLLLLNSPAQQKLKSFIKENNENRRLCSKKLRPLGQPKQSNLFLIILCAETLRKLDLQPVFLVVNLQ